MSSFFESFDTTWLAGGSTIAVVLAALKFGYNALKDERDRIAITGDKYAVEMQRMEQAHAKEREEWRKEKEYFRQEIDTLRKDFILGVWDAKQVAELHRRLLSYDFGHEPPRN